MDLPNDLALGELLAREAAGRGLSLWTLPSAELDHGSVVPLRFLVAAGWGGPTTVVSLPGVSDLADHAVLGHALAAAAAAGGGGCALVASGDMSHRVLPGAPAGHHPRAREFDERVCAAVAGGDPGAIGAIAPDLRALAAEDVVDSCAVVHGASPSPSRGAEVLSYEHPFGVGYLVAVLHDGAAGP